MTISGTGKSAGKPGFAHAFTLVELVIALTVVALLAGLAVPAVDSIQKERLAREPISRLVLLARQVRVRAMDEGRPYQIILDSQGFRASRFLRPYGGAEEADEIKQEIAEMKQREEMIDASRRRGGGDAPEMSGQQGGMTPNAPVSAAGVSESDPRHERIIEGLSFFEEYTFPNDVQVSIRRWNDLAWVALSGGERRRWIFQPSGMCEPMTVRVEADHSFFEVEFHPLTADVKSEKSWVE